MTDALSAVTPSTMATPSAPQTRVEGAAKQFEALMIAQMLRTAREDTEDGNSSSSTMLDVADQQFSQVLASNGGLGLAKLIVKGLHQGQANANQQHSAIK
jgi:Rod binding domain-containing protein